MAELLANYAMYFEHWLERESDFHVSIRDNGIGSSSELGLVSLRLLAKVYNFSVRMFEVQIHLLTFINTIETNKNFLMIAISKNTDKHRVSQSST
jgi:hypothetical protein